MEGSKYSFEIMKTITKAYYSPPPSQGGAGEWVSFFSIT